MNTRAPFSRTAFLKAAATAWLFALPAADAASGDGWIALFDGRSLQGWRASEHPDTWKVEEGAMVADGPRSHLFYEGPVGGHDFRNFELEVEVRTEAAANSGIFVHTRYQETGWPEQGYEIQVNNTYEGSGNYRELKRTGSLYAVRNLYKSWVADGEWFLIRVRVAGNRVCVWVDDLPVVDYLEPTEPHRKNGRTGRILSRGTIALQGHDPGSRAAYRQIRIRLLPDDADPLALPRASDEGFGIEGGLIDRFAGADIPVIDWHVHLRGGMTVEKSIDRQAVTGINLGVLENIGKGWPIETDDDLREFVEAAEGKPVFLGLQVNDRDWHKKHSPGLLERLDFVLADTMIMPMPDDGSEPVKLWIPEGYTIEDPEAWMERYFRHNLRVLAEPISILANPTYLPPPVEHLYDRLWTDERMTKLIQTAIDNRVALEIPARSKFPSDRFLRMAKQMGAMFSLGTNNFDDKPIDMTRCFEAIDSYSLTKDDLFVPVPKR